MLEADLWRDFHELFQSLADEERKAGAEPKDRLLHACCDYREHPEILHEYGKPEQGLFCLLQTPDCGLWIVSDGFNENFRERFQTFAARAGIALACPRNNDPVDYWLHRLLLDLRENRSNLLFADNGEGGMIRRLCEASATFSCRLERKALESAEVALPERETAQGSVGFNQAENFKEAISKKTARMEQIERILNQQGVNLASLLGA